MGDELDALVDGELQLRPAGSGRDFFHYAQGASSPVLQDFDLAGTAGEGIFVEFFQPFLAFVFHIGVTDDLPHDFAGGIEAFVAVFAAQAGDFQVQRFFAKIGRNLPPEIHELAVAALDEFLVKTGEVFIQEPGQRTQDFIVIAQAGFVFVGVVHPGTVFAVFFIAEASLAQAVKVAVQCRPEAGRVGNQGADRGRDGQRLAFAVKDHAAQRIFGLDAQTAVIAARGEFTRGGYLQADKLADEQRRHQDQRGNDHVTPGRGSVAGSGTRHWLSPDRRLASLAACAYPVRYALRDR